MGKDKTKDGETAASEAQDGCRENQRDHSRDQEARDAALAQTIAKAVTRETQTIAEVVAREKAKAHAQYEATVNENRTPTLPTTLKITSGSNGFRIMDPFDWTRDKTIYQRWQLWSHKARLTLDGGRLREDQDLLFPSLDQWGRHLTDRRMEKQQNPHQPVRL